MPFWWVDQWKQIWSQKQIKAVILRAILLMQYTDPFKQWPKFEVEYEEVEVDDEEE